MHRVGCLRRFRKSCRRAPNQRILLYQNQQKQFADFHANQHTFIINLSRVGVSAKTAQTLARHSNIRLTMNTYSHTELAEQRAAIDRLSGLWQHFGSAPEAQHVVVERPMAREAAMHRLQPG